MKTETGMRVSMTRTACKRAAQRGLTPEAIMDVFNSPTAVVNSEDHEGQVIYVRNGLCFAGIYLTEGSLSDRLTPESAEEFRVITVYPTPKEK